MAIDPDVQELLDLKADLAHTHTDHTHPDLEAAVADHETRLAALETVPPVEPPPVEPLGIPCGWFYDWPAYYSQWLTEYPNWLGGTQVAAPPTIARLNDLRSAGHSVIQNMSGFHNQLLTNGQFDKAKWKALVDTSYRLGLEPYIEDGTIMAHYVIDEPIWPSSWGATVPSDVLDELCAYSKNYWPTLPCTIRATPSDLIKHAAGFKTTWPGGYDWQALDSGWLQYSVSKGSIPSYRAAEAAAADTLGVSVVAGINWRDGGDGSSGLSSPNNPGKWVCSPTEVTTYSQGLMSDELENAHGFFMWAFPNDPVEPDYIIDYMNSTPMRAAFDTLKDFCAAKERLSLLRRPG